MDLFNFCCLWAFCHFYFTRFQVQISYYHFFSQFYFYRTDGQNYLPESLLFHQHSKFLMIFLPANSYFSVDAARNPKLKAEFIPSWTIDVIKLLLFIVYFYAGLAKLNSDWLFQAMPLKIWLPAKYSIPLLGDLLQQSWVHFAFAWEALFMICLSLFYF